MMALGAMSSDPNVKVKIVPVGLSYFHAHRFRSRAVIEFGPPLDVAPELVEKFKNGESSEKREAVSKLLNQVYDALKAVTVRAPDYDTLMVRSVSESAVSINLFFAAHSSRTATLPTPWTTPDPRSSCRTQQALSTCLQSLQG
jgi:hypothetical protein